MAYSVSRDRDDCVVECGDSLHHYTLLPIVGIGIKISPPGYDAGHAFLTIFAFEV